MSDILARAVALKAQQSITSSQKGNRLTPVSTPTGFRWTNHPLVGKLFFNDKYEFKTTLDITDYEDVASGRIYYVGKHGVDTNDGLSWDKAFKTVKKALDQTDRKRIYVGAGMYNRNEHTQGVVITKSVEIIGIGDVRFGAHEGLAWTLSAGQTKTYQVTRSNVGRVFDAKTVDANGDYSELVLKVSIAEVEATPGSYWISGSIVYVHTADDRAPDTNIYAHLIIAGITAQNCSIYVENIKFEGGVPFKMESTTQKSLLYARNCSTKYSGVNNGWNLLGVDSILVDCEAAKNIDDGFNYHISTNSQYNTNAIEINCIGRDNGVSSDTDNGSTLHDGGNIIRIGGQYMRNKGANVADVTTGTQSWNLGVTSLNSTGAGAFNTDFMMSDSTGGTIEAWLENCNTKGSVSANNLSILTAGSTVKTRNGVLTTTSGTKASY